LNLEPHELLAEEEFEQIGQSLSQASLDVHQLEVPVPANGRPGGDASVKWVLVRNRATQSAGDLAADHDAKPIQRANGTHLKDNGRFQLEGERLNVAVVTIGYNLPGATRSLVESALRDCRHRVSFSIFSHSRIPEKVAELTDLARRSDVVLRDYGQNRGLAKSWNEGILWGFDCGHDVVLVVNEDVLFAPGDLAKLADAACAQRDRFLVMGRCYDEAERRWNWSEYGCFAINRMALEVLGCFDENFFPIYCEDSDYRRRARLAGLEVGYCDQTALCHCGSASLRDPHVARQNETTYAANRAYYRRKWGGDAGQESLDVPFGDRRVSVCIDPEVREAPYTGFNRTHQHLVLV
jgi:GT2 family glycosyltransferase